MTAEQGDESIDTQAVAEVLAPTLNVLIPLRSMQERPDGLYRLAENPLYSPSTIAKAIKAQLAPTNHDGIVVESTPGARCITLYDKNGYMIRQIHFGDSSGNITRMEVIGAQGDNSLVRDVHLADRRNPNHPYDYLVKWTPLSRH